MFTFATEASDGRHPGTSILPDGQLNYGLQLPILGLPDAGVNRGMAATGLRQLGISDPRDDLCALGRELFVR